jgi:hypothetical protein
VFDPLLPTSSQGWIPRLERKLEIAAETAHPDFRCFFSAEPINGAPHAKIIPESILQTCIKVRLVLGTATAVDVHTSPTWFMLLDPDQSNPALSTVRHQFKHSQISYSFITSTLNPENDALVMSYVPVCLPPLFRSQTSLPQT